MKRVIKGCFLCKLYGATKPYEPLPTAPLPKFRVQADHAIANVGVDYLGPLFVKNIFGNTDDVYPVHVVLYTCATSRADHLDLVPDPSCLSFVKSFKRFIGRFRIPKLFISDNATCFIGPELTSFALQIGTKWEYIIQASSWWGRGGFGSVWFKVLNNQCALGKSKLTYEELLTVIAEVEGVLNSRPLCYVYEDSVEEVLTPSHLMIGR